MIVIPLLVALALPPEPADAVALQDTRFIPVARIAPAPLPRAVPLLEAGPRREVGTPERYVDRAGLRSLLVHRRFAELTRYLEQFQAAFEQDPSHEDWPSDAASALGTGEPELMPLLDAWVADAPRSFAPWLARGTQWEASGWLRRGAATAGNTPRANFDAMEADFERARADLSRALALRPRLVAARVELMRIATATSDREAEAAELAKALSACPTCFLPRATFLAALQPKWGGSDEAMVAFAEASVDPRAPRLRFLRGYVDLFQVSDLEAAHRRGDALKAVGRALALGDHVAFYWRRGRFLLAQDVKAGLADLERAREHCPGEPGISLSIARAHQLARRWELAATHLREALRVEPLLPKARDWHRSIVEGLAGEAGRRASQGRRGDALRLIDLAVDLAPDDESLLARREAILGGGAEGADAEVADLERRVAEAPDDLDSMRRLDLALSRGQKFERLAALWSDFVRRHPEAGRAWLERGGALQQLGRSGEALEDARRACDLGLSEGCFRVRAAGG